jgi:hypothetical protein
MSSVKLIMKWDIRPGKDQEYFEFVVREWVPATNQLGLQTVGAWYSVYARDEKQPRIMAEALADDISTMREILNNPSWASIHERLLSFVDNYSQKVVYTTGDFQL